MPLYETIYIWDSSRLISDQLEPLFPDWFGGIHLACQSHAHTQGFHSSNTGAQMQHFAMAEKCIEESREGGRGGVCFVAIVHLKKSCSLLLSLVVTVKSNSSFNFIDKTNPISTAYAYVSSLQQRFMVSTQYNINWMSSVVTQKQDFNKTEAALWFAV